MSSLYAFLGLFILIALTPVSALADAPTGVSIKQLNAAGDGCQSGSVASVLAPDGSAFTLLFDHFAAEAGGPQGAILRNRQNCDVDLLIASAPGWQFGVFRADYRGFAQADQGANVFYEAEYSFDRSHPLGADDGTDAENPAPSGHWGRLSFNKLGFTGPHEEDYTYSNEIALKKLKWSPCGNLQGQWVRIHNSLVARSHPHGHDFPTPHAIMTLDSIDGAVGQVFGIAWQQCGLFGAFTPAATAK